MKYWATEYFSKTASEKKDKKPSIPYGMYGLIGAAIGAGIAASKHADHNPELVEAFSHAVNPVTGFMPGHFARKAVRQEFQKENPGADISRSWGSLPGYALSGLGMAIPAVAGGVIGDSLGGDTAGVIGAGTGLLAGVPLEMMMQRKLEERRLNNRLNASQGAV